MTWLVNTASIAAVSVLAILGLLVVFGFLLQWHWRRRARRRVAGKPLEQLIAGLPCAKMREAMTQRDPAFARSMIEDYWAMSPGERKGIDAFFEEDGPRRVDELQLREADGTPTGADLKRWLEEGAAE